MPCASPGTRRATRHPAATSQSGETVPPTQRPTTPAVCTSAAVALGRDPVRVPSTPHSRPAHVSNLRAAPSTTSAGPCRATTIATVASECQSTMAGVICPGRTLSSETGTPLAAALPTVNARARGAASVATTAAPHRAAATAATPTPVPSSRTCRPRSQAQVGDAATHTARRYPAGHSTVGTSNGRRNPSCPTAIAWSPSRSRSSSATSSRAGSTWYVYDPGPMAQHLERPAAEGHRAGVTPTARPTRPTSAQHVPHCSRVAPAGQHTSKALTSAWGVSFGGGCAVGDLERFPVVAVAARAIAARRVLSSDQSAANSGSTAACHATAHSDATVRDGCRL
mmetsp:Transcript_780/g.2589  ORF Transcript_780/g.2589 Transcript_780/m.2589 type:complete len:339 (-) Transcript_780:206-1222(-)